MVEIPFEAADQSAVIAVVHPGGTDVWAVDEGTRQMQPILQSVAGWDGEARFDIHAAFYDQPLDALGLVAGRIESVGEAGRPLPLGQRTVSTSLDGSNPVRWSPATSRPVALDRVRIPGEDTPCQRYTAATNWLRYDDEVRVKALLRGPDGEPWIVRTELPDEQVVLERIGADGQVVETFFPDLGSDLRIRTAAAGPGGEVWLAGGRFGDGLSIQVGPPNGPFREVVHGETPLSSHWPRELAIPMAGEPAETIYYLSAQGELQRYADGETETLATFDPPDTGETSRGRLVWASPGVLYASPPRGDGIYRVEDGEVVREVTALDQAFAQDSDLVEVLSVVPGKGVWAGLDGGFLLQRTDAARWEVREENQLVQSSIEVIQGYGEGLLVAGRYGIVDQWYRDIGYCVSERTFVGGATIEFALQQPEGILVAGTIPVEGPDPWFVTWLRANE